MTYFKDIEELGYSSHLYAEHATRIESNFHDVSLVQFKYNGFLMNKDKQHI